MGKRWVSAAGQKAPLKWERPSGVAGAQHRRVVGAKAPPIDTVAWGENIGSRQKARREPGACFKADGKGSRGQGGAEGTRKKGLFAPRALGSLNCASNH